ncbi:MAG TPA: serine/threonine-protein kinase [Kofleriaceae bacterium]|nr:serine/threonine-protein kinase [Kofleriaceae bacterium]
MAPTDGTGPATANTPVPLEGDGTELIGMVVDGRYRLDDTLGRGGMGLVFRATHIGLRRQVAVKILHPSLAASPDVRNRFEREALAVGKVDHPNCVATYDVGRLPDGSLYLAMELLEGRSLADVLEQEGQLAPGRALHILTHILRGLGSIHAANLVHRDIKPENIFLIRQGDDVDFAKILDFGIAKPMTGELSDDGVRLTQAGMAFGTPIYMAPEQALGSKLDGRADLYAAAVMAYEMLVGQPPFYSEDKLEVMSMHTAKAVPPMRSRLIKRAKPVPSSIERLIIKGLTKKPADRYESAEVFLAKVEEALHTPDGGQTDVNFERVHGDTGSHPLIDDEGDVNFAREERAKNIADSIDETLYQTPTKALPAVTVAKLAASTKPGAAAEDKRAGTKLGVAPAAPPPPSVRPDDSGELVVPAGGQGIGLPFTAPGGHTAFGLTPEQRLAQVPKSPKRSTKRPKKKRWPLYAAILGAALAAGISIAIVTAPGGGGESNPAPGGSGSAVATLDPNLKEAQDALFNDPVRAIQIIEQNKATLGKNATAQMVLGDAHMIRKESAKALAAYKAVLALEPSDADNETLRTNLRALSSDRNNEVAIGAMDLWFGSTADTTSARDAIVKAAITWNMERRHMAQKLVESYKLGDSVDWLTAHTLDLEQDPSCERRKDAVEKLRALGNPKALKVLEAAVAKRLAKKNGCLLIDARAGIAALSPSTGSNGSGDIGSGSAVGSGA